MASVWEHVFCLARNARTCKCKNNFQLPVVFHSFTRQFIKRGAATIKHK
jgi:hypothetical protein